MPGMSRSITYFGIFPLDPCVRCICIRAVPLRLWSWTMGRSFPRLLVCAAHVVVPVHKRTLGVVFPCPNVEFEERREAVTVRGVDVLHEVTLDLGSRVGRKGTRENDELDGNQFVLTVRRRLVDQSLRLRWVNGSVHQTGIDVVDAHGAMVGAADATEDRTVSSGSGCLDVIQILRGGIANNLDELVRARLFLWLRGVLGQGRGGECKARD